MLRLLRESSYRGSLIQVYERPCRGRDGMECVVLIDWMDVTSPLLAAGGANECERRDMVMIDEFCAARTGSHPQRPV